jgi:hypothetical protein
MKWYIRERDHRETEKWRDYMVSRVKDAPEWKCVFVSVDMETKRCYCCQCSGPLSAQLESCVHARAVKRFVRKLS